MTNDYDIVSILSKIIPQNPKAGPPLPKGLGIGWPTLINNFLSGVAEKNQSEGFWNNFKKGPGFLRSPDEIKEEIGWIFGIKGGKR